MASILAEMVVHRLLFAIRILLIIPTDGCVVELASLATGLAAVVLLACPDPLCRALLLRNAAGLAAIGRSPGEARTAFITASVCVVRARRDRGEL